MTELSESDQGLMQEEWDAFSLEHRNDFQSTFAWLVAKDAFIWAYKAAIQHEREKEDAT